MFAHFKYNHYIRQKSEYFCVNPYNFSVLKQAFPRINSYKHESNENFFIFILHYLLKKGVFISFVFSFMFDSTLLPKCIRLFVIFHSRKLHHPVFLEIRGRRKASVFILFLYFQMVWYCDVYWWGHVESTNLPHKLSTESKLLI